MQTEVITLEQTSDKELVRDFQNGDTPKMEVLIRRYQQKVFNQIVKSRIPHSDINDVFQNTFMKAIEHLRERNYEEKDMFEQWIYRLAQNEIKTFHRKRSRFYNPLFSQSLNYEKEYVELWEVDVLSESIDHAMICIETLPDKQKEVVMKHLIQGATFQELAENLDCSLSTIISRYRNGIFRVRELFQENMLLPNELRTQKRCRKTLLKKYRKNK